MNCNAPAAGSMGTQAMYFGNDMIKIGCSKPSSTSYVGGKLNTQKCLHACTKENGNLTNGVTNNSDKGYCAPACCCVAYSTSGTKPGDWYLPLVYEVSKINNIEINNQRQQLKGSSFNDGNYWSSNEDDYTTDMYYNTISSYGSYS